MATKLVLFNAATYGEVRVNPAQVKFITSGGPANSTNIYFTKDEFIQVNEPPAIVGRKFYQGS